MAKQFSERDYKLSAAVTSNTRPRLLHFLQRINPAVEIIQHDRRADDAGDKHYAPDMTVVVNGERAFHLEDEVRPTGWVTPTDGNIHKDGPSVPTRSNKLDGDLYVQFRGDGKACWVAPTSVIRTWPTQNVEAANNDGLEGFYRGSANDVDMYTIMYEGKRSNEGLIEVSFTPHDYFAKALGAS